MREINNPSQITKMKTPYNAVTGAEYKGGNVIRLSGAEKWATFKQWLSVGKCVRKGEHGEKILVVKESVRKDKKTGKEVRGTAVRSYTVFHDGQLA